jgi:acetyl esterase
MPEIKPVLEPAAQDFADSTAKPPFLYEMPPAEGRMIVDSVQDGEIPQPPVDMTELTIPGGPETEVAINLYRPRGLAGDLPVLLYTHGAGWVFGDAHTHGRLVAELATRAGAAVVFTNYSLSPEAKYPTALEEIYLALQWIAEHGSEHGLDPSRIAVAGDSVGGNVTAAITMIAKQRGGGRASPLSCCTTR